jgi:hypothetical protein
MTEGLPPMAYELKRVTDSERLLAANREDAKLRARQIELGELLQQDRPAAPEASAQPDRLVKLVAVTINRTNKLVVLYPDNATARTLAEIAKARTFSPRVIALVKRLGYRIETRQQTLEEASPEPCDP